MLHLASCEDRTEDYVQEVSLSNKEQESSTAAQEKLTPIILGKQLENPFSIENMQIALDSLKNKTEELADAGISNRSAEAIEIYPTDWYIRFTVDSTEFNKLISDSTLSLSQIPLDYEIIQEGDYLEEFQQADVKTLYATVKPGYTNPYDIEFEILEELFIPENSEYYSETDISSSIIENRALNKKLIDNDLVNALIIQSFVLTGNENQLPDKNTVKERKMYEECVEKKFLWWRWTDCDTYYYPEGFVKYETPKGYEPVKGVKMVMWRWFYRIEVTTDANGYFISDTRLNHLLATNNVQYYLKMEGQNGQNRWSQNVSIYGALCFWNDNFNLGSFSPNMNEFKIGVNHKAWGKCLVNNAIYNYIDIVRKENLTLPPKYLKVGVYDQIRSSSAPLLNNHINISLACGGHWIMDYMSGISGTIIAYTLVGWGLPDLLLCYEPNLSLYNNIISTIWHELTHASHVQAMKNKKGDLFASYYWSHNVYQQVKNQSITGNPYGNKGDDNWQYIALSEGWANYREWKNAKQYLKHNSINTRYPNYTPLNYEHIFVYAYASMFLKLANIGCTEHELEDAVSKNNTISSFKNFFSSHKLSTQIKNIIRYYE